MKPHENLPLKMHWNKHDWAYTQESDGYTYLTFVALSTHKINKTKRPLHKRIVSAGEKCWKGVYSHSPHERELLKPQNAFYMFIVITSFESLRFSACNCNKD